MSSERDPKVAEEFASLLYLYKGMAGELKKLAHSQANSGPCRPLTDGMSAGPSSVRAGRTFDKSAAGPLDLLKGFLPGAKIAPPLRVPTPRIPLPAVRPPVPAAAAVHPPVPAPAPVAPTVSMPAAPTSGSILSVPHSLPGQAAPPPVSSFSSLPRAGIGPQGLRVPAPALRSAPEAVAPCASPPGLARPTSFASQPTNPTSFYNPGRSPGRPAASDHVSGCAEPSTSAAGCYSNLCNIDRSWLLARSDPAEQTPQECPPPPALSSPARWATKPEFPA